MLKYLICVEQVCWRVLSNVKFNTNIFTTYQQWSSLSFIREWCILHRSLYIYLNATSGWGLFHHIRSLPWLWNSCWMRGPEAVADRAEGNGTGITIYPSITATACGASEARTICWKTAARLAMAALRWCSLRMPIFRGGLIIELHLQLIWQR